MYTTHIQAMPNKCPKMCKRIMKHFGKARTDMENHMWRGQTIYADPCDKLSSISTRIIIIETNEEWSQVVPH